MKKHVDNEDKLVCQIDSAGQKRDVTVINESGLYSLVLLSKLPAAKKFKRWITSEVIPSIRKHGAYIAGQEELSDRELIAKALVAANSILAERSARLAALHQQNLIMAPKAEYYDDLVERGTLTNFRETAKELGYPPKKSVQLLLDEGFVYRDKRKKLMPYAAYVGKEDSPFEVKESRSENTEWSGTQTLITVFGRGIFRKLCEAHPVEAKKEKSEE